MSDVIGDPTDAQAWAARSPQVAEYLRGHVVAATAYSAGAAPEQARWAGGAVAALFGLEATLISSIASAAPAALVAWPYGRSTLA